MKQAMNSPPVGMLRTGIRYLKAPLLMLPFVLPASAHASLFQGEALDKAADVMTWVVLVVAPAVAIGVFLLIHILPEKIAEKKQHPQTKAIQCLCLLSLFFGGMLWPLAWLWAYSKPVMYKMAYGTDKVPLDHDEAVQPVPELTTVHQDDATEVNQLRKRIAELEIRLASTSGVDGGKV